MNKLRIACIGARLQGHAGGHYKALAAQDNAELCAACDLDQNNLNEVVQKYAVPALYTDYSRMIGEQRPDAVVIVMRPMQLIPIALDCLDMGADLLIEKPPGCTLNDTKTLLNRARANGCKVMVSVDRRFIPLVREVKKLAHEHGLTACSATYNKAGVREWDWPASLVVADAIHLIDLLCYVCGAPKAVYAESSARNTAFNNSASALVAFESGCYATLNTHYCVGTRKQLFEVHAEDVSAYMNLSSVGHGEDYQLWVDRKKTSVNIPEFGKNPTATGIDRFDPVFLETEHFIRWLTGREPAEAALEDVFESVRLAEAIDAGYKGDIRDYTQGGLVK